MQRKLNLGLLIIITRIGTTMRDLEFLLKTFSQERVDLIEKIFTAQVQVSEQAKLSFALEILNINRQQLSSIPLENLKHNLLDYHALKNEVEFHPKRFPEQYEKLAMKLLALSEVALNLVRDSELLKPATNSYSKYSMGLFDLHIRSPYYSAAKTQALTMDLTQSIQVTSKKSSGVEPGFKGILLEDLLLQLKKKYPNKTERLACLAKHQFSAAALYKLLENELPDYLIKLDYDKLKGSENVKPNKADLARSSKIQKIAAVSSVAADVILTGYQYLKTKSTAKVNKEAVIEALSNDVARVHGMKVQDQRLLYGTYEDGRLKLMLKGAWLTNIQELGPLQGGKTGSNGNYMVQKAPPNALNIKYFSNANLGNLGFCYPLFLVQNDYDAIGSQGQNKLHDGKKLIGIDFGHAYAAKNQLISKLDQRFRFQDEKYKNFSVFFDSPRLHMVKGLLVMAKLAGVVLDANIIKAYGEDFYQSLEAIKPGDDKRVFDDYEQKFAELLQRADLVHRKDYQEIITGIQQTREYAISARNTLVSKFQRYLSLPPQLIELGENLEKLHGCILGNATIRSENGQVLLNHLQVVDAKKLLAWPKIHRAKTQDGNNYLLEFEKDKAGQVSALFKTLKQLWPEAEVLEYSGKYILKVSEAKLATLGDYFNEQKLKQKYFPAEYQFACQYAPTVSCPEPAGQKKPTQATKPAQTVQQQTHNFFFAKPSSSARTASSVALYLDLSPAQLRGKLEKPSSIESVTAEAKIEITRSLQYEP